MADLGTIGFGHVLTRMSTEPINPSYTKKAGIDSPAGHKKILSMLQVGQSIILSGSNKVGDIATGKYTVSGTVSVLGANQAGWKVRVYRRDTGIFLSEAVSKAGGTWSAEIVGYNGLVTAIAFDGSGIPIYNAIVFDQVTPA